MADNNLDEQISAADLEKASVLASVGYRPSLLLGVASIGVLAASAIGINTAGILSKASTTEENKSAKSINGYLRIVLIIILIFGIVGIAYSAFDFNNTRKAKSVVKIAEDARKRLALGSASALSSNNSRR